jgi:capsid assembly protease
VRTEHMDTSTADAARGVKRTIISAGKYKAAGDGPLTPESFAYKQAQVDYLYTVFVDWMASMRGVSAEQVLADMADGRVFIGQQAIDAGLADGFASLEGLIAQMASDPLSVTALRAAPGGGRRTVRQSPARASAAAPAAGVAAEAGQGAPTQQDEPVPPVASTTSTEGTPMSDITRESLERDHSALFAAVRSEFTTAGAQAERDRIKAVRAQTLPGCEALIETLAFDGQTTGPEAAMAVLGAQREALAAAGRAHHADAPAAVPSAAAPGAGGQEAPAKRQPSYQAAYAGLNKRPA